MRDVDNKNSWTVNETNDKDGWLGVNVWTTVD